MNIVAGGGRLQTIKGMEVGACETRAKDMGSKERRLSVPSTPLQSIHVTCDHYFCE